MLSRPPSLNFHIFRNRVSNFVLAACSRENNGEWAKFMSLFSALIYRANISPVIITYASLRRWCGSINHCFHASTESRERELWWLRAHALYMSLFSSPYYFISILQIELCRLKKMQILQLDSMWWGYKKLHALQWLK